jgi:hypothetical protein
MYYSNTLKYNETLQNVILNYLKEIQSDIDIKPKWEYTVFDKLDEGIPCSGLQITYPIVRDTTEFIIRTIDVYDDYKEPKDKYCVLCKIYVRYPRKSDYTLCNKSFLGSAVMYLEYEDRNMLPRKLIQKLMHDIVIPLYAIP